jgi:site-specific DNA-methyltransferase (adenine-specific)
MYGSGFPKSLDVSKAIDKAAGAEREVIGTRPQFPDGTRGARARPNASPEVYGDRVGLPGEIPVTAPATDAAARWEGWGTALKPAHEPIVVARKPLAGTVAANVLEFGTGALNIDRCRVGTADDMHRTRNTALGIMNDDGWLPQRQESDGHDAGRWPPNILLTHSAECEKTGTRRVIGTKAPSSRGGQRDMAFGMGRQAKSEMPLYTDADGMETVQAWECAPDCPVGELDRQTGVLSNCGGPKRTTHDSGMFGIGQPGTVYADTGGASRFFPALNWDAEHDAPFMYCAKAPKSERPTAEGVSAHPTVKPLALMRWLVRLVTPPGGLVLDPFAGTGTTGQACALEGFRCVLAEKDPDSAELARVRLAKPVQQQMTLDIPA